MTNKYWSCDSNFSNATEAGRVIAKLAAEGIGAVQFDVFDECSDATVFFGLWAPAEEWTGEEFEQTVRAIVDKHGWYDQFGLADHKPIPADFGYEDEPTAA